MLRHNPRVLHIEYGFGAGNRVRTISLQLDRIHAASMRRVDQPFGLLKCGEIPADLGNNGATVSRIVHDYYNFSRI